MLQKPLQIFKPFQSLDQLFEVFQAPRRLRRFVILPMGGVATFIEDDFRKLHMGVSLLTNLRVPAVNAIDQARQFHGTLAAQIFCRQQYPRAFHQRHAIAAGSGLDFLLRLVAQPTLGRVDDALKGQIIIGADRQTKIGHSISDFHPLVKPGPANHTIGQTDGQKAILKSAHLMGGAHQNRHTIEIKGRLSPRAALRRLDLLANPARLFLAIPMANQPQLFALFLFGPKRLAQTAFIAINHCAGRSQNMRRGAVVLLQTHHMRTGKIGLKPQNIPDFRTAPAVNRLIIIANAANILMPLRQEPEPQILRHIGVLIFVHQNIAKKPLVLCQDFAVFL